jgi:hypothetical protein
MEFNELIERAFSINESTQPSVIAIIDIVASTEYETNLIIYGVDISGQDTSPRNPVNPDPLGLGTGGAEYFADIKNQSKTTTWKMLTEWMIALFNKLGLDPMINPDSKAIISKMIQPQLSKGMKSRLVPIGDQSGSQGMEIQIIGDGTEDDPLKDIDTTTAAGKKKSGDIKRSIKRGIQYVLDVVVSPGLGQTKEEASDDLYTLLLTNKPDWFSVDLPEDEVGAKTIYISTSYEEVGYPNKVYVGPDSEHVNKLENWINLSLMKTAIKGRVPNYSADYAPEPLRTELKTKIAELQKIFDEGEKQEWEYVETDDTGRSTTYAHKYVVDPKTDEGRLAIRHRASLEAGLAASARSRKAAATIGAGLGDRYSAQFVEAVTRIIKEGREYGISEDRIVNGIISLLRRYDINIRTLDDFKDLDVATKRKAADRLRQSDYIDVHGIWESVIPSNINELNVIRLVEYKSNIDGLKSFLIENPAVYAQSLRNKGFDDKEIASVMESYSLPMTAATDDDRATANMIIEASSVVDSARRLFNMVASVMDSKSVFYADRLVPSDIIGEDGKIVDEPLIESASKAGVNIIQLHTKSNGSLEPSFLARMS